MPHTTKMPYKSKPGHIKPKDMPKSTPKKKK